VFSSFSFCDRVQISEMEKMADPPPVPDYMRGPSGDGSTGTDLPEHNPMMIEGPSGDSGENRQARGKSLQLTGAQVEDIRAFTKMDLKDDTPEYCPLPCKATTMCASCGYTHKRLQVWIVRKIIVFF
jgi:hypothetical protein